MNKDYEDGYKSGKTLAKYIPNNVTVYDSINDAIIELTKAKDAAICGEDDGSENIVSYYQGKIDALKASKE